MSDTIAAIATARAPSAIGILRLTGEDTAAILDKVFRPKERSVHCHLYGSDPAAQRQEEREAPGRS